MATADPDPHPDQLLELSTFRRFGRRPAGLRWSLNRIAVTYLALAVLLLPWVVLLAVELPNRQVTQHYKVAWVGFDILLAATLSRTAWLAWQRSPYLVNVASVAATMLVVDAWFDITTADSMRDRYTAVALAVLVELPLAAFSLRLARRAQQLIAARGSAEIAGTEEADRQRDPGAPGEADDDPVEELIDRLAHRLVDDPQDDQADAGDAVPNAGDGVSERWRRRPGRQPARESRLRISRDRA